ncbi:adenylyl-sulfate kinase [Leptolyngbya sp. FACHB-17]|uniref:adenylyl-sulfate kinase n=1 Tax=unclassified Leptolyngbya TaxID=2650499 RepID=UPI0016805CBA|nr:adenylyl-sulfate kinase [Leptolyngbya sp. FACHB-17]MBD2080262.1 adenylyl-sulfate kinase [Leptolyngbya sp. FACHB-17]
MIFQDQSIQASENCHSGLTVWLTGLSGAGKTTISNALAAMLCQQGYQFELLDGDVVRQSLTKGLGFSKADREENIRRIGFVANLLTKHNVIVIVSAISPYRGVREEVRQQIGADSFVEVYVDASVEVCEQRDVKGLYQKVRAGEIKNFTGIDDPYEPPINPDVVCHTEQETIQESTLKIMEKIESRGLSKRISHLEFQI